MNSDNEHSDDVPMQRRKRIRTEAILDTDSDDDAGIANVGGGAFVLVSENAYVGKVKHHVHELLCKLLASEEFKDEHGVHAVRTYVCGDQVRFLLSCSRVPYASRCSTS